MTPAFVGSIFMFGGNFQILDWAYCAGQLIAIQNNTTLFTLIGTTYGGDGVQTFALPDLRGRVAIGQGQGNGLPNYVIGQAAGTETTTLNISTMPAHTHLINVNSATGSSSTPANGSSYLAGSGGNTPAGNLYNSAAPAVTLSSASVQSTGSNIPFSIIQPVLCTTYLISLYGVFPTRN